MTSFLSNMLDFNKSTLSGAIDVIAVLQEDGSIKSTPFHVRFGKFKVMRPKEKRVYLTVNGNPIDLEMRLDREGEAFFLRPKGREIGALSPDLLPLECPVQSLPSVNIPASSDSVDNSHQSVSSLEDVPSSVDLVDVKTSDAVASETTLIGGNGDDGDVLSVGAPLPLQHVSDSIAEDGLFIRSPESSPPRPGSATAVVRTSSTSPNTNVLLEVRRTNSKSSSTRGTTNDRNTSPHSLPDLSLHHNSTSPTEPASLMLAKPPALQRSSSADDRQHDSTVSPEYSYTPRSAPNSPLRHAAAITFDEHVTNASSTVVPKVASLTVRRTKKRKGKKGNTAVLRQASSVERMQGSTTFVRDNASTHWKSPLSLPATSPQLYPTDSTSADIHRGVSGEPFHNTISVRVNGDETVGIQPGNSGSDPTARKPDDNGDVKATVGTGSSSDEVKPVTASNNNNSGNAVMPDIELPPQRWYHYFWRRGKSATTTADVPTPTASSTPTLPNPPPINRNTLTTPVLTEDKSAGGNGGSSKASVTSDDDRSEIGSDSYDSDSTYDRGAFHLDCTPNTKQLSSMGLQLGANTITFDVYKREKKSSLTCKLYLWTPQSKVIISDIDGTITKSDVWGHIYYYLGKDWTHSGVAKLYTTVKKHGYEIMYLTARAIGQSDSTRQYLENVRQSGDMSLPPGPVLTSPDRLVAAFKREVIEKKPQEFKIDALKRIRSLFPSNVNCFYAGFGNRDTDVVSYEAAGVPAGKIFLINPEGKISHLNKTYRSSYDNMSTLADEMFPAIQSVSKWQRQLLQHRNNVCGVPLKAINLPTPVPTPITVTVDSETTPSPFEFVTSSTSATPTSDAIPKSGSRRYGAPVALDEQYNTFNYWKPSYGLIVEDPEPTPTTTAISKSVSITTTTVSTTVTATVQSSTATSTPTTTTSTTPSSSSSVIMSVASIKKK